MPTAIVTGGSQGFGLALTAALTEHGWNVIVDARDADRLRAATDPLQGRGQVEPMAGDVTDSSHQQALVAAAGRLGGLDLLVHNASELGPSPMPALVDYPGDALSHVFAVNVLAPIALTARALPLLQASAAPVVVALSSDAAVEAYEGWGGYGASKAALDHAMAVLAEEQPQMRVYAFDPGDMRTAMHQRAFPGEDITNRPRPDTVVPPLLRLLSDAPPSGRYRAADLGQGAAA